MYPGKIDAAAWNDDGKLPAQVPNIIEDPSIRRHRIPGGVFLSMSM